jgi:hypothetical protein
MILDGVLLFTKLAIKKFYALQTREGSFEQREKMTI